MKMHCGLAWPDADRFMVDECAANGTYQLPNLVAALRHVKNWSVACDLGAHVGTWTKVMAGRFASVVAFEPSQDTFECLQYNVLQAGLTNVQCLQMAVGAAPGFVTMALDAPNQARANTGARFTRPGGAIPVTTIDSLGLTDVGFIKLDIEGSEPAALEGAAKTIATCRPVVLYENKALWTRNHGLPKDAVERILRSHHYILAERVSSDEIWIRGRA